MMTAIEKGAVLKQHGDAGVVELELKVGRLTDGEKKFVSSLDERTFSAMERLLGSTFSWIALPPQTSTDVFVRSGKEECRLTFVSGQVVAVLAKERLFNTTLLLPDGHHALRVSLSVERPFERPPPGCASLPIDSSQGWTQTLERKKERRSFLHRSARGVFQVDMTRTSALPESGVQQFEVELEFLPWALNARMDDAFRTKWCEGTVDFVMSLLEGQINEQSFPGFMDLYTRPANEQKQFILKSLFFRNFALVDRSRMGSLSDMKSIPFPGTLPKPLTRAVLRNLNVSQFKVSEKTDGARYFMLILNQTSTIQERGVYLVDRNVDFFQLDSNNSLLTDFCSEFAGQGPTLLDGEIILTPPYGKGEVFQLGFGVPTYMVFDIVTLNGRNLHDEPLAVREQAILEQVSSKFVELEQRSRKRTDLVPQHMVYFPIFINRKKLFSVGELGRLESLMHTTKDGKRLYLEKVGSSLKRFHLSDGLILTHCGPYFAGMGDCSFKWKYAELVSIDFALGRGHNGRRMELYLGGSNELVLVKHDEKPILENEDALKKALVAEKGAPASDPLSYLDKNRVIVELAFNRDTGCWIFECIRTKLNPNHITVGFQTMEQMMETPITIQELKQHFSRKP